MDATLFPNLLGMIPVGPILWGLSILAGIVFVAHAAIMMWHWREYSTGASYTSAANMLVYLGVGLGFVVLMLLSSLWYSLA